MFESFKINIAALEALAHECPMPRNVPTADRSQDFYEKILKTCTHEGVIDGADLSALKTLSKILCKWKQDSVVSSSYIWLLFSKISIN